MRNFLLKLSREKVKVEIMREMQRGKISEWLPMEPMTSSLAGNCSEQTLNLSVYVKAELQHFGGRKVS